MKFSIDELKRALDKDRIGGWIVKYKRQVAVGCIAVCLVAAAAVSLLGNGSGDKKAKEKAAVGAAQTSAASADAGKAVEEANELKKDEYPQVNEIVQKYFDCMAAGDVEGLASVEDEVSEEEQNRILRSTGLVEGYQNISCYTKKGMEENSYVVLVYYELKFAQIETPAPGLSLLYVYTNDEGNLVIFNGEAGEELNAYVEEILQGEDVAALRAEVKAKYEEAKAADADLVKQEERYQRIAQGSEGEASEEETPEEQPEEETPEEETPEEQPEEAPEEEPQEEPEEEAPAENTATAQNRETRFTESVRLRAEPSTEAEYLGTVYQGESVTQIESYEDGWSKINYNGKECYCMTQYLE